MRAEVAIVGGGAAGLATAWRLGLAGVDAVLLERFRLGHDRGSSHGATRIFRFAYDDPLYVRMAQDAVPLWRELGADLLAITGGIDIGSPAMLRAVHDALTACGAAAETVDATERARRWPWLHAGDAPVLYSPDTGVIAAARALRAMADSATASGVRIMEQAPVEQVVVADDRVLLKTNGEDVEARRAVLAAGAWSGPLLATLGLRPTLRVTREQVAYFDAPFDIVPFIDRSDRFRYGVPKFGGAPGIKVAEHEAGKDATADDRSFAIDAEGMARVRAYVRSMLPDVAPEPLAHETCLYTLTPNEDFLIDVHGPVVIASPCSGHGFKFAPLIGEILARLATGKEVPHRLDRFALTNFGPAGGR